MPKLKIPSAEPIRSYPDPGGKTKSKGIIYATWATLDLDPKLPKDFLKSYPDKAIDI